MTVDGGFVRVSPLEESWRRFTGWLEREAPASHDCLNPPALPADIEAAEAANGARFPEDLRQLLSLSNGSSKFVDGEFRLASGFFPGGHRLLSALEVVEQRRMLDDILNGLDENMVGWWWHPQWIPFAAHIAADALVIDLRDGPQQGAVGEFMHEGNTTFDWGPSLAAVIADVAGCVEAGLPFKYFHPRVIEERLDWEVIPPQQ